jgi:hypothetical protein
MRLIHPPVLLNSDSSEFGPPRSLEHPRRYLDDFADILLVSDAIEQLFIGGFVSHVLRLTLSERHQLLTIYVGQVYLISGQELLKQVNDVRD